MAALRQRLARAWPHLRVILVGYHVAAIVVLSIPPAGALNNPAMWRSANTRSDIAGYAAALGQVGVEITPEELGARVRDAAATFGRIRELLAAPFAGYAALVGARQGWAMFASPQRVPAEVHVDLEIGGEWRPLYRPHDDAAAWRRATFEHNRFRKFNGRFARTFIPPHYDGLARWLAREAAAEFPEATAIRVRLYRYRTLPPAEARAGRRPEGRYEHERRFVAEELR
ncbi:MAG: hypothetical protein KC420_03500 [Myxococcales bacterium]|nr:hypothetical protein [Myxococcales bacterium]